MIVRVADYVMKRIANEGVDKIFYVPGGQCVFLCDALRRCESIEPISVHHEQTAAMAALAYSEYTNNFGACLVTTGCAGTNTLTGVLHAWQDSIPMIVVSGQQNYAATIVASGLELRQAGVQEADTQKIVSSMTKYAVTVPDAKTIAYHMDKAIYMAREGRKGPVWIDIPLDVQNAMVDEDQLERFVPETNVFCSPSEASIKSVIEAIKNSNRPVLHIGYGVKSSDALAEFIEFAELSRIPVTLSRRTYDMLPNDCSYNFGILNGTAGGHRYANFMVQNSDLLISVGSRLSRDTIGGNADTFARAAKVIVVDIDEVEHKKNLVKIDEFIHSDAKAFFVELNRAYKSAKSEMPSLDEWVCKCNHWKDIFNDYKDVNTANGLLDAKYAMKFISSKMPVGSVVVSDAGFTGAAAPACGVYKKGDGLVHSFAQGEMGFSIPGACGVASVALGPVLAYEGDGSFMMNLQELQTIKRNNYNIKIILINNNGYCGVRHGQKAHFRGKTIGTDSSNGVDFPDFSKIASAFGIKYLSAKNVDELIHLSDALFNDNDPALVEIFTDPDQFDLHNALVISGKRNVAFRPIEDQSPFIDREVFFKEMIIEPLESSSGKPI